MLSKLNWWKKIAINSLDKYQVTERNYNLMLRMFRYFADNSHMLKTDKKQWEANLRLLGKLQDQSFELMDIGRKKGYIE